jgi:hypothetical protein
MFFFLSLRESSTHQGTIEPDVLPSSSSHIGLLPPSSQKSAPRWSTSAFREYITDWEFSDRPALFRRCACILALFLHTPINIISILSYGFSFMMFFGIIMSVLNLFCVALALWKLDIMRGQRMFYTYMQVTPVSHGSRVLTSLRYERRHFDYVILGLLVVYGSAFGIIVFFRFTVKHCR